MAIRDPDALARIETLLLGIAEHQRADGDTLRMIAEDQKEIRRLLAPQPKDGPGLDELLVHIAARLGDVTGLLREIVKRQGDLEDNLPGDVVRAMRTVFPAGPAGGSGPGPNGSGSLAPVRTRS